MQTQTEARTVEYHPEFARQVEKISSLAATDADIADFFEIDLDTLEQWKANHRDFRDALRVGQEKAGERVKRSLYHKAIGYTYEDLHITVYRGVPVQTPVQRHVPPDTAACIFWLCNRQPDQWSRNHVVGSGDRNNADLLAELIEKLPN
ncbi:terminase [Kordiimonas sp.]|uniref:terminase n=1 Tax=Kordiimonas sp. TaxID=1970157 RepID=UPI003A924512